MFGVSASTDKNNLNFERFYPYFFIIDNKVFSFLVKNNCEKRMKKVRRMFADLKNSRIFATAIERESNKTKT